PPGSGGVITGLEVDEGGGGGAFVPDKPPVPLESPGRLEVPPVPGTSTSSFVCSPLVQPSSASASAPAATERTRCAPSLQAKRNTPGLTQWSRMSGMRHDAEKRLDNQRTSSVEVTKRERASHRVAGAPRLRASARLAFTLGRYFPGKLQPAPCAERPHGARSQADVPPGRHVEVEMVGVVAVPGPDHAPEDVASIDEPLGDRAEEPGMDRPDALLRSPMAEHAHLEGATEPLRQPGRQELLVARGTEVEAKDVERIAERMLAQAVRPIARRAAAIRTVVTNPEWPSSVGLFRHVGHDLFEPSEALEERFVHGERPA